MTRDQLERETRRLIDEGERLIDAPTMPDLRAWIQRSDDLLIAAWGQMDRYHLAWLMVGRPKDLVRGRPMTAAEERAYVREVAEQKTAALRMSLKAVTDGMPFLGAEVDAATRSDPADLVDGQDEDGGAAVGDLGR